jgi:hypothetical protein
MKIGLDFHGVMDKYPKFFSLLTNALDIVEGTEIHVITGCTEEETKRFLERNTIVWHKIYSITDDFLNKKHRHRIDKFGNPCFAKTKWDKAKAIYCEQNDIDIMLDDSSIYGKYFTTPYAKLCFNCESN